MEKDINVQLMDELMNELTQTEMWSNMFWNDPAIMRAHARWEKALESIKSLIPRDLYVELSDAEANECSAAIDAAILYGIHVVDAMRDVAARPSDLSRYILARMGEGDQA